MDKSKTFDWNDQVTLFCSQILFGSISATQVFYWMTYLNLHVYYPALVSTDKNDENDIDQLSWIEGIAGKVFIIALATPFIAIFVLLQQLRLHADDALVDFWNDNIGRFLASGVAYMVLRRIQSDVTTLGTVLTAAEQSGLGRANRPIPSSQVRGKNHNLGVLIKLLRAVSSMSDTQILPQRPNLVLRIGFAGNRELPTETRQINRSIDAIFDEIASCLKTDLSEADNKAGEKTFTKSH